MRPRDAPITLFENYNAMRGIENKLAYSNYDVDNESFAIELIMKREDDEGNKFRERWTIFGIPLEPRGGPTTFSVYLTGKFQYPLSDVYQKLLNEQDSNLVRTGREFIDKYENFHRKKFRYWEFEAEKKSHALWTWMCSHVLEDPTESFILPFVHQFCEHKLKLEKFDEKQVTVHQLNNHVIIHHRANAFHVYIYWQHGEGYKIVYHGDQVPDNCRPLQNKPDQLEALKGAVPSKPSRYDGFGYTDDESDEEGDSQDESDEEGHSHDA